MEDRYAKSFTPAGPSSFLNDASRKEMLNLKLKFYAKILVIDKNKELSDDKDETEEIEDLLKEIDEFSVEGNEVQTIRRGNEEIKAFQKEARGYMQKRINTQDLRRLHRQAKRFGITFKEAREIKKKYLRYREIGDLLQTKCKMSVLKEIYQEFHKNFIDDEYSSILNDKMQKIEEFEKKIKEFLQQEVFTMEDITVKCTQILQLNEIEFEEKEKLLSLQNSFQWLKKLYNFWIRLSYNDGNKMEGMSTNKGDSEEDVDIDTMIQVSSFDQMKELEQIAKDVYLQYKNILEEGRSINHRDKRIQLLSQNHSIICWVLEALRALGDSSNVSEQEICDLYKKANDLSINPSNYVYLQIEEAYNIIKCNKWKQKVEALINSEAFESILKETQVPNLNKQIAELVNEYEANKFNSENEIKVLKTGLAWSIWTMKANQVIEAGEKVPLEELQLLLSNAMNEKVPQNCSLYQEVEALCIQQMPVWDAYVEYMKFRKELKEMLLSLAGVSDPKEKKAQYEKIASKKPELDQVIELDKMSVELPPTICKNELEDLKNDINLCQDWCQRVDNFKTSAGMDPAKLVEKMHEIKKLHEEAVELILCDKKKEKELYYCEWAIRATIIFNTEGDRKFDIEYWKDLRNFALEVSSADILDSEAYKEIEKQIALFESLNKRMQAIFKQETMLQELKKKSRLSKIRSKFIKVKKALKLVEELGQCKIDCEKDKKHIEDLLEQGKKAKEMYEKIKNSQQKVSKGKVSTTLGLFYKLPFLYPEEKKLESFLKEVNRLNSVIQKNLQDPESWRSSFKTVETFYNEYKGCCITIAKGESICKLYLETKNAINDLESSLEKSSSFSFEELQKLTNQVNDMKFKDEPRIEKIKRKLWVLKVNVLKSWRENMAIPEKCVPFSLLKEYLLEGYDCLTSKEAIQEIRSSMQYFENMIRGLEEQISKLVNNQHSRFLEEIGYKLQNFIDIKEEILELKVQAAKNSSFNLVERSIVRDMAKKGDEEILQPKKSTPATREENTPIGNTPGKKAEEMQKSVVSDPGVTKVNKASKKKGFEGNLDNSVTETSTDKYEKIVKMVEKESGSAIKKEVQTINSANSQKVDSEDRVNAKKKLVEGLKANPYFEKVVEFENEAKQIEMNIFSEFSNKIVKYQKRVKKISNLFTKLRNFQMISEKLIKNNFKYSDINKIKNENLGELEKELTPNALEQDLRSKIINAGIELEKAEKAKQIPKDQTLTPTPTPDTLAAGKTSSDKGEKQATSMAIAEKLENQKKLGEDLDFKELVMVFEGELEHRILNKDNPMALRCSFSTCDSSEIVKSFPTINEKLRVNDLPDKKEILKNINKLRKKKELLFGWICCEEKYKEDLRAISNHLAKESKLAQVGCTDPEMEIFLIPASYVSEYLEKKCLWEIKYPQNKERNEIALFFSIHILQKKKKPNKKPNNNTGLANKASPVPNNPVEKPQSTIIEEEKIENKLPNLSQETINKEPSCFPQNESGAYSIPQVQMFYQAQALRMPPQSFFPGSLLPAQNFGAMPSFNGFAGYPSIVQQPFAAPVNPPTILNQTFNNFMQGYPNRGLNMPYQRVLPNEKDGKKDEKGNNVQK